MEKGWVVRRRQLSDEALVAELLALEAAHGMTSGHFLNRYNRGELGDDAAYIRWSGLLAIAGKVGIALPVPA